MRIFDGCWREYAPICGRSVDIAAMILVEIRHLQE
jgi:hypothetical protein